MSANADTTSSNITSIPATVGVIKVNNKVIGFKPLHATIEAIWWLTTGVMFAFICLLLFSNMTELAFIGYVFAIARAWLLMIFIFLIALCAFGDRFENKDWRGKTRDEYLREYISKHVTPKPSDILVVTKRQKNENRGIYLKEIKWGDFVLATVDNGEISVSELASDTLLKSVTLTATALAIQQVDFLQVASVKEAEEKAWVQILGLKELGNRLKKELAEN